MIVLCGPDVRRYVITTHGSLGECDHLIDAYDAEDALVQFKAEIAEACDGKLIQGVRKIRPAVCAGCRISLAPHTPHAWVHGRGHLCPRCYGPVEGESPRLPRALRGHREPT